MEQVTDIIVYSDLIKAITRKYRTIITNCYLSKEMVERYISMDRLLFKTFEGGILFLTDEKFFYNEYYFMNPVATIPSLELNKMVVVKNLYKEKRESLLTVEKAFEENGFLFNCTFLQLKADVNEERMLLNPHYEKAMRLFELYGLKLVNPSVDMLDQIRDFQFQTPMISFWDFMYFSNDELMKDSSEDKLRCVVNSEGVIIGAVYKHEEGMGWIAVKDEYRLVPGVAIALSMPSLNNANTRKIWVRSDNIKSMKYHLKLGYNENGLKMDEWVKHGG